MRLLLILLAFAFAGPVPAKKKPKASEKARISQQHYLNGVIFYQKNDYEKAREEWKLSLKADPSNKEAAAGLERVEKLYGPGPSAK